MVTASVALHTMKCTTTSNHNNLLLPFTRGSTDSQMYTCASDAMIRHDCCCTTIKHLSRLLVSSKTRCALVQHYKCCIHLFIRSQCDGSNLNTCVIDFQQFSVSWAIACKLRRHDVYFVWKEQPKTTGSYCFRVSSSKKCYYFYSPDCTVLLSF